MNLSLDSKVAVITGGSRGIGAATVRLFAAAGAKVVFNYQSAKAQADELVRECGAENCRAVQCELSTTKAAGELVSAAVAAFGRLDILVANHGIWPSEDAPVDRMTNEQWHRTIAVNLDSVFGLVKHAVGQMKKQRSQTPPQAKSGIGDAPEKNAVEKSRGDGSATGHIVLVSST
ncbi:MAG: SDR family NAD(P)-dependent oxidoreductase, partial [Terriglobales bacterium]